MTADETLDQLQAAIHNHDDQSVKTLVAQLVLNGVYPPDTPYMQNYDRSHLDMVESWGARWHLFRGSLNCPHCNADLRDLHNGPPFKREIGIEIRGLYDGVHHWQCPDCHKDFPRPGITERYPINTP